MKLLGESLNVIGQFGERVRKISPDHDIVIIIVKFKSKGQFKELEELGSCYMGLLILNVVAASIPTVLAVVFMVFLEGKNHRFVAILEKRMFLFLKSANNYKVHDHKSVLSVFFNI
jgi:hypothetical protein